MSGSPLWRKLPSLHHRLIKADKVKIIFLSAVSILGPNDDSVVASKSYIASQIQDTQSIYAGLNNQHDLSWFFAYNRDTILGLDLQRSHFHKQTCFDRNMPYTYTILIYLDRIILHKLDKQGNNLHQFWQILTITSMAKTSRLF